MPIPGRREYNGVMIAVPVDLLGKIIKGGEGGGGIKAPHTYSNAIPPVLSVE